MIFTKLQGLIEQIPELFPEVLGKLYVVLISPFNVLIIEHKKTPSISICWVFFYSLTTYYFKVAFNSISVFKSLEIGQISLALVAIS